MTPQSKCVYDSISTDRIPKQWQKISYPSVKCFASYLNDFCDRLKWIQHWWSTGQTPDRYWLSALFRPCSFLTAIKLDFARKYDVPLEGVTIDFAVVNEDRYFDLLACLWSHFYSRYFIGFVIILLKFS